MFSVRSMNDWLSRSIAQPRLNAVLVTAFGCLALLTAAIGVYGVLSYLVNQRTREIELRMALGAQRQRVIGLVIKEGMILALTGIAAGVLGALLVSVAARDASTFVVTAITLILVALAACIAPAVRAPRVDPILALRCE
jgi:putative ABC transport system permease protein